MIGELVCAETVLAVPSSKTEIAVALINTSVMASSFQPVVVLLLENGLTHSFADPQREGAVVVRGFLQFLYL